MAPSARVVSADSETQLTIDTDIFPSSGDAYEVWNKRPTERVGPVIIPNPSPPPAYIEDTVTNDRRLWSTIRKHTWIVRIASSALNLDFIQCEFERLKPAHTIIIWNIY